MAQVKRDNMPAYKYGYKHPKKSYMELMSKVQLVNDYDTCLANIMTCIHLNGFVLISEENSFTHFDEFLNDPEMYLT